MKQQKLGYIATILQEGLSKGIIPNKTHAARIWYRNKASQFRVVREYELFNENKNRQSQFSRLMGLGSMYMFFYDAKHAKTLPWWDRFPLVIPYKKTSNGFYGLNLHYLPLEWRGYLMDELYNLAVNTKYDESTRLRLTANTFRVFVRLGMAQYCMKKYLYSRLRSKVVWVHPKEWDIALFLPSERFMKASKRTVWHNTHLSTWGQSRISGRVQRGTKTTDLTPETGALGIGPVNKSKKTYDINERTQNKQEEKK